MSDNDNTTTTTTTNNTDSVINPNVNSNNGDNQIVDIVVVASCNVDLISYVDRMPKLGETLMGKEFKMGFGGKGANKAIACSRLGSKCAVIAKVGNDVFGKDYIKNFKDNNIRTDYVFITDKAATGVAPICVDQNGNNSILVILGANLLLDLNDVNSCENLIKKSKILVTNLEIPIETALRSLILAKLNNVITILNFAPASINIIDDTSNELFTNTDFLILNEVEAEQLSKLSVKSIDEAKLASNSLLDKFDIKFGVIITLGENGVLYTDRTKTSFHKSCKSVKVVDTSGAGDAFVGAFAHYLSHYGTESINKVIALATDYASLTVQSLGTQTSYPHLNELDSRFHLKS